MTAFFIVRASRLAWSVLVFLAASATAIKAAEHDRPSPAAVRQAEQAMGRFKVPEGLRVELFAAEPLLANPVAFCFDEQGRMFVAEAFRIGGRGVEDNRGHMYWLDDDLAAKTVEDRVAYMKKHHPERVDDYTRFSDRIKLIEDTDGDGRADRANVFAGGFNDIADGLGSGVLARSGDVYYTNIPHLWKLRDTNDDGRADERNSLHYGYGVHFAFFGHDLHGLTIGPDGRLYFSIGDRGFNVVTKEGARLINTDSGAVLRCELDGSKLEIFCKGLRNPQELAFDDYGNLFTCDNNSDSGDRAKWYYLVEGADYGWRMHYQYLSDRGPWNREKLWHPQHEGQAAYIVPCIVNITDGPSGITYYPGTGLGDEYCGHFFVCDFRGGPANSCVFTWSHKPKGASFELTGERKFLEGMLATDCDFGADGALYIADWIDGWNGTGKGRIYRVVNPTAAGDPRIAEVTKLLSEGFNERPTKELVKLLGHADRRVRLEAQSALAARGAVDELVGVAKDGTELFARIHGIWGLGQIARRDASKTGMIQQAAAALIADPDEHVRAQVVRLMGEVGGTSALPSVIAEDESLHVRHLAAIAAGKQKDAAGAASIAQSLENVADPVLRHSLAYALSQLEPAESIGQYAGSPQPGVRMGILLAWRRLGKPKIATFLADPDQHLIVEAARAIHDMPIVDAYPQLAALIDKPYSGSAEHYDALFRRVLNANFRLGTPDAAAALAAYAGRRDAPEDLRIEALEMLSQWARPSPRDRVLGSWRPLDERDASIAAAALRTQLAPIFSGAPAVRRKAAEVASKLGVKEVVPELVKLLNDTRADAPARAAALAALGQLKANQLEDAAKTALSDEAPELRIEGRRALAKRDPSAAIDELKKAMATGTLEEKQAAIDTLGFIPEPAADEVLLKLFAEATAGTLAAELRLDVITTVRDKLNRPNRLLTWPAREELRRRLAAYDESIASDPSAGYRLALVGGDAARGKTVFFEKVALSCLRCHKVGDDGGEVGPDLTKIAADKTREYLLESIVEPNKTIAKGFETIVITRDDGRALSGIVKTQSDQELTLITPEATTITIPTDEILERTTGQSAMPADLVKQMTLLELRDLIEFLNELR
jgi:quinoprotein glucose dehydrogenase